MGLVKALLMLPLTPLTGLRWLSEVLAEEAERERARQSSPELQLAELEAKRATGEISDEESEALEAQLVERMLAGHGMPGG
jgi:Gas vesicle protein G